MRPTGSIARMAEARSCRRARRLIRRPEWIARQLTGACGWDGTPEYLVRDRDAVYGEIFIQRLRAMGIRDWPIAPPSPWQNRHAERLIGSLRQECLNHVVVFNERHLRQLLLTYMAHYNFARTHLSLNKDAPMPRAVQTVGRICICANPILGGLHHQYVRIWFPIGTRA
jgi:Integrase core domain